LNRQPADYKSAALPLSYVGVPIKMMRLQPWFVSVNLSYFLKVRKS